MASILVAYHERGRDPLALARALNGLANARFRLGETVDAKKLYQRALKEYRKAADRKGQALVLMNLGSLAAETLTDVPAAREEFSESLSLFRELGMSSKMGSALSNLAALSIADGDYEQALVFANEALVIFDRLGNNPQATILGRLETLRTNDRLPRTAASIAESAQRELKTQAHLGNLHENYVEVGRRSSTQEMERVIDGVLSAPAAFAAGTAAR